MKMLCEETTIKRYNTLLVEGEGENKKFYLQGIFGAFDMKNGNGRIYPEDVYKDAVNRYIEERVNAERSYGELNHPDRIDLNPKLYAHKIVDLWWEDNILMGKTWISEKMPEGKTIIDLAQTGYVWGISSRALGEIEHDRQKDVDMVVDLDIKCWDLVDDPSTPNGFVKGIYEGISYIKESNGGYTIVEEEFKKSEIITESNVTFDPYKFEEAVKNHVKSIKL